MKVWMFPAGYWSMGPVASSCGHAANKSNLVHVVDPEALTECDEPAAECCCLPARRMVELIGSSHRSTAFALPMLR